MSPDLGNILIVQTSFLGDVILATAVAEKLHRKFPEANLDFLLREGNQTLVEGHPFLRDVLIWNKQKNKYGNLLNMVRTIRAGSYDLVVNLHRFPSSGILTALSGAKTTTGFDKNPFSRFFTYRYPHLITKEANMHEIQRNQQLISHWTGHEAAKPRLYPSMADFEKVRPLKGKPYITIAPASVWSTKQFPAEKWIKFITELPSNIRILLIGGPNDVDLCGHIAGAAQKADVHQQVGRLSLLQTAALMKDATMNFANDSAPLHLASAVDAPVAAIFCSTIPEFGFGPLSVQSFVIEKKDPLYCRPCGLHGFQQCPEGHFRCALEIPTSQLHMCLEQSGGQRS